MGRPKLQPTIIPPNWWPTLKAKFLKHAFSYYPSALEELVVQVKKRKITLRWWAENWGVGGTWIEQWAKEALIEWGQVPPDFDSGFIYIPVPKGNRAEDGFSFTIKDAMPDCRLAFGASVGGVKLDKDQPADDWKRFRDSLHRQLDAELDIYLAQSLHNGSLQEFVSYTDEDLDLKLQVAAHYVFGKKSAEELGQHPAVARERSVITRWLEKILPLLDLRPAKPGTKRGSKRAPN